MKRSRTQITIIFASHLSEDLILLPFIDFSEHNHKKIVNHRKPHRRKSHTVTKRILRCLNSTGRNLTFTHERPCCYRAQCIHALRQSYLLSIFLEPWSRQNYKKLLWDSSLDYYLGFTFERFTYLPSLLRLRVGEYLV